MPVLFPLLFFMLLLTSCGEVERVGIRVGDVNANVELAFTNEARRKGLMGRERLGRSEGMLFVFPREKVREMWMLNVPIPLDVGFFDRRGQLLDWQTMAPDGGRKIYRSSAPALYVLEMNRGWFARHQIEAGARLELPHPIAGR